MQALSIDAARSNVEAHFTYICSAFEGFMRRYAQQSALHAGAGVGLGMGLSLFGVRKPFLAGAQGCCLWPVVVGSLAWCRFLFGL